MSPSSSNHTCETCGGSFTVTPAVPASKESQWQGCLAWECPSYTPSRDATLYLEQAVRE